MRLALRLKGLLLALPWLSGAWPHCALANDVPGERRERIGEAATASRIGFVQNRLDQGTASARLWWYGWLAGYSAATLAQGAVGVATHDRALRATMLVGAGGSALGAFSVIAFPFPPTHAASDLRASDGMPAQQRQALALASLKNCADAESLGRSWLPHALGAAVAAAQGLVLWIGFDQPIDGAESAAVSLLVSEAQIFSQPMRAVGDLASYERQFSQLRPRLVQWHLAPSPRGVALLVQW